MKRLFGCAGKKRKDHGKRSRKKQDSTSPQQLPLKCEELHHDYFHTSVEVYVTSEGDHHDSKNVRQDSIDPSSITPPTYPAATDTIGQDKSPDTLSQSHDTAADDTIGSCSPSDLSPLAPDNIHCSPHTELGNVCHPSAHGVTNNSVGSKKFQDTVETESDCPEKNVDINSLEIDNTAEITDKDSTSDRNNVTVAIETVVEVLDNPCSEISNAITTENTVPTPVEVLVDIDHCSQTQDRNKRNKDECIDCKQCHSCTNRCNCRQDIIGTENLDACIGTIETEVFVEPDILNINVLDKEVTEFDNGNFDKSEVVVKYHKEIGELDEISSFDTKLSINLVEDTHDISVDWNELQNKCQFIYINPDRCSNDEIKIIDDVLKDQAFVEQPVLATSVREENRTKVCSEELKYELCTEHDKQTDGSEATNDSLHVNVDTDSVNTATDNITDEFCTQYSVNESDDEFDDLDDDSDTSTSNYELSSTHFDEDLNGKSELFNRQRKDESLVTLKEHLETQFVDKLDDAKAENKDFKNVKGSQFDKLHKTAKFDSDNSIYHSFYSLENAPSQSSIAVTKSLSRKTLKWTPRILSETRFSSNNSTFSDVASFYTAETCGTFHSAREFQLDSCDNFQTCEDFKKLNPVNKSKLSKAKDALARGKNFVKSKFENYRKRLNLRKVNSDENTSKRSCHHSCGFACVHIGKEISQYSIPDYTGITCKEDNSDTIKGSNSNFQLTDTDLHNVCGKGHITSVNTMSAMAESMIRKGEIENRDRGSNLCVENLKGAIIEGVQNVKGPASTDGETGQDRLKMATQRPGILTVKMKNLQRETTAPDEDDLPVGTEAINIPRSKNGSESGNKENKRLAKRQRWISAIEQTQGTSINSSATSNSSVEQFLQQREMDPETLLDNLGFGVTTNTEDPLNKIPDRFLLNQQTTQGINLYEFVLSHPELHHLLPIWEKHFPLQGTSNMATAGGSIPYKNDGGGNQAQSQQQYQTTKNQGSMQRPHAFSSVLHGMKFIHSAQTPSLPSPDEEVKKISSIRSVLDLTNRKALARQGFYGEDYVFKDSKEQSVNDQESSSKSLSASQKRRQFHHCGKSKNWSFTEEADNSGDNKRREESSFSTYSFDEGLQLRSFSERYSSDSSLESCDSFGDERKQILRQSSISHLRKQYQETIRKSMDGDIDVFDDFDTGGDDEYDSKKASISDARKKQVDRLMLSIDDDGDYFAKSRQSSLKEVEPALKRAQKSTQSTLTGSPMTPKDFNFSFDKTVKDGQSEFQFSSPSSPHKVLQDIKPTVSIVVEDESEDIEMSGEVTQSNTNPNELTPLSLVVRSDSCNTLVPQDSSCDTDNPDGDSTPRGGDVSPGIMSNIDFNENDLVYADALSESTSSLETLITMLPADHGQDFNDNLLQTHKDFNDEPWSIESTSREVCSRSRSPELIKCHLQPTTMCPPQESFELEEISSATSDLNGNSTKSQSRRGIMEKSASTHSDSSGFADIDLVGETTPGITDLPKEMLTHQTSRPFLTKQTTFDKSRPYTSSFHDNKQSRNKSAAHWQTENCERRLDVHDGATVHVQYNNNQHSAVNAADENHNALYICKKGDVEGEHLSEIGNYHPSVTCISYNFDEKLCKDKSVVYTLNIPLDTDKQMPKIASPKKIKSKKRYVSTVRINMSPTKDNDSSSVASENVTSEHSSSMQIGQVNYHEIRGDLDPENSSDLDEDLDDLDYCDSKNQTHQRNWLVGSKNQINISDSKQNTYKQQLDIQQAATGSRLPAPVDQLHCTPDAIKHDILCKKRSKEALIAANNQTADWLLSNERHNLRTNKNSKLMQKSPYHKIGKPIWASTPDLKSRHTNAEHQSQKKPSYKEGSHSLEIDLLSDDESSEVPFNPDTEYGSRRQHISQNTVPTRLDEGSFTQYHRVSPGGNKNRRHLEELRQDSACSSMDESIPIQRSSVTCSLHGVPADNVQYLKLTRLVNGTSSLVSPSTKMPIVRFTPNFHSKNWMELPKKKHLEEETRLIQHAVQRYKAELTMMETTLFTMYQTALPELSEEERADVEELQHLWSEVRKEVSKMEQLLSARLSGVMSGNDGYNPLDALEIVEAMITLLREQLYHQQMCISKDISFGEEDNDDIVSETSVEGSSSVRSVSSSGPWWSDLSQQMLEVKHSMTMSQESQRQELRQSMTELREGILSEVKGELLTGQNGRMMELKIQAQENEIRRLKMELLLQNVNCGGTRKRQMFESDV